ncbi:MAG: ArnT family glycosyltransferase [Candidatus Binatia bacterium]
MKSKFLSRRLPIFLFFAALVFISKLPILDAPHYWDEMSWVSQAHWLSRVHLARALPGLRAPDAFWGHPPGLHLGLASAAKVFGYSVVLSHLIPVCFAFLGVWFMYLLGSRLYDGGTGFLSALFLFLSPMYFAQSGMFLADLPVTALGVMSVYFALWGPYAAYLLCATYMVFVKETSIALLVALLLYLFLIARPEKRSLKEAVKYGIPLLMIGLFFVWQKITTGHFFFIYDPLKFDIKLFELSPSAILDQFFRITRWVFIEQERYIFSGLILLNLVINGRSRRRPEIWLVFLIILFSAYSFLVLFFLPRYLLPALPYLYLLGAWSLMELARPAGRKTAAALVTLLVMGWSLATQPFRGNAEFNPRYLDVVSLHKEMCEFVMSEFPDARILTSWPHTVQLLSPHLGYVRSRLRVVSYHDQPHAPESDLLLVSLVPASPGMKELSAFAAEKNWRLIKRLEKPPVVTELYGRASLVNAAK